MTDPPPGARLAEALDLAEAAARAAGPGDWGVGRTRDLYWGPHQPQEPGTRVFDADGEWPKPREIRGSHVYANAVDGHCGQVAWLESCGPREARAEHIAAWDPATVLRLIERDRALLAEYHRAAGTSLAWVRAETLHREVERAAEFWDTQPKGQHA